MVSMAGAWLNSFSTAAGFSVDFAFTVLSLDTSSEVIGLLFSILDMIIIFNLIIPTLLMVFRIPPVMGIV